MQTYSNGLLHMRARYYNPHLCHFLNADPSGFSGGLNFYAYADGNPVSLIDPFGLGAIGENGGGSWISSALNFLGNGLMSIGNGLLNTVDYAWTAPNTAVGLVAGGVSYIGGLIAGTHPEIHIANNAVQFLNLPQ